MLSCFNCFQLFATPWTVARQAPLSVGFSRQESWRRSLCRPPGDLPDPGIELESLTSPALAGGFFTTSATWEAPEVLYYCTLQGVVRFKMFYFLFFMSYLHGKYYKPIIGQYRTVDCVSWVPRLALLDLRTN